MGNEGAYLYDSTAHNMDDPRQIVPLLYQYFSHASVVDLGCGIGNFLHEFKDCGVNYVLGIDGAWSDNDQQMLTGTDLLLKNLNEDLGDNGRFELAISLEVAEHLDKKYAEKLIKDLADLSDVIVFSAAIPGQGGQDHINEQWPEYWAQLFNNLGYDCYDVMRPLLWNNPKVSFWYKQNMFVAVNRANMAQVAQLEDNFPFIQNNKNVISSLVHPLLFDAKINENKHFIRLLKGKASFSEYKTEILRLFAKRN